MHGPIFHVQNQDCSAEARYMNQRRDGVQQYFKDAMGVDDFLARTEIELCKHGFTGDNSIGDECRMFPRGKMPTEVLSLLCSNYKGIFRL